MPTCAPALPPPLRWATRWAATVRMRLARALDLDQVILVSPQFTLDRAILPAEKRYPEGKDFDARAGQPCPPRQARPCRDRRSSTRSARWTGCMPPSSPVRCPPSPARPCRSAATPPPMRWANGAAFAPCKRSASPRTRSACRCHPPAPQPALRIAALLDQPGRGLPQGRQGHRRRNCRRPGSRAVAMMHRQPRRSARRRRFPLDASRVSPYTPQIEFEGWGFPVLPAFDELKEHRNVARLRTHRQGSDVG